MSDDPATRPTPSADAERIARLEERLARLEAHLGLATTSEPTPAPVLMAAPVSTQKTEDELEFEVGQNWFAVAGILALTLGAVFLLSLPFANLPVGLPSVAGYGVVVALFVMSRVWRESFVLVASYLRGVGMALFFFSTLRLFFPETRHVLSVNSLVGRTVLVGVVALNLVLALRRQSPWLVGVALLGGVGTALAVGAPWFALGALLLLAGAATAASHRGNWPGLGLAAIPIAGATYVLWAIGNPLRGGEFHWISAPTPAPLFLLALAPVLALVPLLRPREEVEGAMASISALLVCLFGYGVFLVHTAAAFAGSLAVYHALAFVVFLGLAVTFWLRRQSRAATFFYAMTGYMALSVAILKAAPAPAVFVWLSVQSVVVVATAIWFRSRFIVVANFLIYLAIVLGYAFVVEHESGISLVFGVVALVSARILNWQQRRLELKTTLMRNAYLVGAFVVFPYALYHLVPARHVGLAWVGLALGYYALNFLVQNQKYRWMGHATLLLTTCYVVVVGTSRFEPVYRVLSFLVLGTVLLVVSLVFTRLRKRQRPATPG